MLDGGSSSSAVSPVPEVVLQDYEEMATPGFFAGIVPVLA